MAVELIWRANRPAKVTTQASTPRCSERQVLWTIQSPLVSNAPTTRQVLRWLKSNLEQPFLPCFWFRRAGCSPFSIATSSSAQHDLSFSRFQGRCLDPCFSSVTSPLNHTPGLAISLKSSARSYLLSHFHENMGKRAKFESCWEGKRVTAHLLPSMNVTLTSWRCF